METANAVIVDCDASLGEKEKMQSLRKLMNKPRPDDWAPLSKFFYADETLNEIANELDSFDGRRDPDRCNHLVNKLRVAQDRMLHIIGEMITNLFPRESDRACRDFRVKFPDEIVHDTLPGQLWFGAECLAAGSNIIDHEDESDLIRPLAKELTRHLDSLRDLLKAQSLKDPSAYTETIKDSLIRFDRLFAEFEFQYVSAMVPVKSVKEHDAQLDVAVLFSEVLNRAIIKNLITQDQIDYCDPSVMIAIPRLGIVWGLLYYPQGALNVDGPQEDLSEMFRPFYSLLVKIRNLLRILSHEELCRVEIVLCKGESSAAETASGALTMSDFRTNSEDPKKRIGWLDEKPSSSEFKEIVSSITADSPVNTPSSEESGDDPIDDGHSGSDCTDDSTEEQTTGSHPPDPKNLRQKFRSSEDLVHRLFVCIAGVADQLQTNYSSEVRKVLKLILQPSEIIPIYEESGHTATSPVGGEETGIEVQESLPLPAFIGVRWVPDEDCDQCTACSTPFNVVRRRHHCRNCGRIFCNRCSSNSISIPELGYDRKVRVCNLCYLHRVSPFPCGASGNSADTNPTTETPTN